MYDWETRLTTRDTNRVVRPLDWGLEWTRAWPCVNGSFPADSADAAEFLMALNQRIVAQSREFFAHHTPQDFHVEHRAPPGNPAGRAQAFLRFTSPVSSPYPENNTAVARWFPARGRRAVVVLPQWNSNAESHNGLCRIFQFQGIAALRLSMPYHDARKPPETERADYAVSANLARTIDAARQAVIDVRCCLDWLEQQGYTRLGIVGTSLGSCYAFLAGAHDPRLKASVYNHGSMYFGEVMWTGQSTRHVRAGIENEIDLDGLRAALLAISPAAYFDKLSAHPRRSLVVYATYDLTFLPEFSQRLVAEFHRWKLDTEVAVLPCGHYTTGEFPYKYLDAFYVARFLESAL